MFRIRLRSRHQLIVQVESKEVILAERERGLTVVSLEGDALSGFEHATLDLVQGDAVGGGQVTLGDGDLGAQREGTQVAVALARLDSRLVGLVDRQIGIVRQRDGQGVLEVLRVVGELAIDLLRHREALAREGIRGRTETHRHRDGRKLLAGHIELHGAGELTDDASGTLGTLNASRNLDDRRLVRGDLREGHGQLLGRALDRRSSAEGIIRGVLAQALTLGRGRIDDDEGVLLDVVDHRVAVVAPARAGGSLVDDRRTGHCGIASGQDHSLHDGLVLIAILAVAQADPAFLDGAGFAGVAHDHVDVARKHLVADLHLELLVGGAGVLNHGARRHGTCPLGSRVSVLVEDDVDNAISTPRAAADDNAGRGTNIKGTLGGGARDRLARVHLVDGRVVSEEVTGLDGAVDLPRQLNASIPHVRDCLRFRTLGIDQLQVIPVQVNLVVDVGRGGRAHRRRGQRRAGRQQLQSINEAQYQSESYNTCAKPSVLQRNHKILPSMGMRRCRLMPIAIAYLCDRIDHQRISRKLFK